MFTLCYYAAIIIIIMLPLYVYYHNNYAAINLPCYYAAVMLLFKVYYAINFKSILCCYCNAILIITTY